MVKMLRLDLRNVRRRNYSTCTGVDERTRDKLLMLYLSLWQTSGGFIIRRISLPSFVSLQEVATLDGV